MEYKCLHCNEECPQAERIGRMYAMSELIPLLKKIESGELVSVVHGRWERVIPSKSAAKWSTKVSCSICHRQGYTHHNYCPYCGAKMDGDVNE